MSYIGRGIDQIDNVSTLDNLSFNGSLQTFNLTQNSVAFTPVSADALQIQIDGIIQAGNYSVANATLTFDFVPSSSSVCNSVKHFGVGLLTTVSDSSITTAKLGADSVTTAKINDGAVTSGKIASGVVPTLRPNAQALIINGDMAVAQRSTSVTGITGSGYNTIDRFKVGFAMGTWTQTQESLTSGNAYTDGFSNALKMDCTTADTSVGSSDRLALSYNIEGQDLQLLKKGTANAEKITISFWVKATKTGTNILELYDNDNNRHISIAYTVSSSNTWEKKVVNFSADTSGALGDDNGSSIAINWWLGAGSNFSSGTLATAWASVTDANRAVGQVNHADSTSNNFHVTGIQLEVGEYTSSTLPPFQHESYGDNLARCHRYYTLIADRGFSTMAVIGLAVTRSSTRCSPFFAHPVSMRTTPSLIEDDTSSVYRQNGTSNTNNDGTSPIIDQGNIQGTSIEIEGFSGLTAGEATTVKITTGGKLSLSAEL